MAFDCEMHTTEEFVMERRKFLRNEILRLKSEISSLETELKRYESEVASTDHLYPDLPSVFAPFGREEAENHRHG